MPRRESHKSTEIVDVAAMTTALAKWFRKNARPLSWRTTSDPYPIWVSEIMAQQTQVSVVDGYHRRFMARFPDVAALAAAPVDDVLALWSGLGYYARGRNLHRAAQCIVRDHDGVFPTTRAALLTLPGIGPYTSAAIASISFGERAACVDGNVQRVLARVLDIDVPVDRGDGQRRVAAFADALMAHCRVPRVHNEALMELGALVCTPSSPSCDACPIQSACLSSKRGTTTERPVRRQKAERKSLIIVSPVVFSDEGVLLVRREDAGLFGGLYAPPSAVVDDVDPSPPRIDAEFRECLHRHGISTTRISTAGVVEIERTLTHRRLQIRVLGIKRPALKANGDTRMVEFAALSSLGMSSTARAILEAAIPNVGRFFGANRRHR